MTLFWDWNGTLLDDTAAASGALNAILGRRSLPPVSLEEYRATFSFPARNYYERAGLDLANEDWDALALEYHEAYLSLPKRLARDAEAAVSMARSAGFRQYVLSAMKQELLASETAKYGAGMEFDGIWGTDNLDGGSKLDTARRLAASLPRGERAVVVVEVRKLVAGHQPSFLSDAESLAVSKPSPRARRKLTGEPLSALREPVMRQACNLQLDGGQRGVRMITAPGRRAPRC